MGFAASGPFHADVTITTKGTAVQVTTVRTFAKGLVFAAYDGNQGDIFFGVGSGVNSTKGNYGFRLRPGDKWEPPFVATPDVFVDASKFWINNDVSTGFDGDGMSVMNAALE